MASFRLELGSIIWVKFKTLHKIDTADGSGTLSLRYAVHFWVKFKPLLKIDTADGSHTLSVRYTVTFFVSVLSTWNSFTV